MLKNLAYNFNYFPQKKKNEDEDENKNKEKEQKSTHSPFESQTEVSDSIFEDVPFDTANFK